MLIVSTLPTVATTNSYYRFCGAKYNSDMGEMDNPFIHLTNVAIQKHNQDYNNKHGGKWHIKVMKLLCILFTYYSQLIHHIR